MYVLHLKHLDTVKFILNLPEFTFSVLSCTWLINVQHRKPSKKCTQKLFPGQMLTSSVLK